MFNGVKDCIFPVQKPTKKTKKVKHFHYFSGCSKNQLRGPDMSANTEFQHGWRFPHCSPSLTYCHQKEPATCPNAATVCQKIGGQNWTLGFQYTPCLHMWLKSVLFVLGITRIKVKRKFTSLIISWWLEIEHGWFVMIHVPHKRDNVPDPAKKQRLFHTFPFLTFHNSTIDSPVPQGTLSPSARYHSYPTHWAAMFASAAAKLEVSRKSCSVQVSGPSTFMVFGNLTNIKIAGWVTQTSLKHSNLEFGDVFKFQLNMITS